MWGWLRRCGKRQRRVVRHPVDEMIVDIWAKHYIELLGAPKWKQ